MGGGTGGGAAGGEVGVWWRDEGTEKDPRNQKEGITM